MNFRVVWSPDAFHSLLREWNAAGNPQTAIEAFDQIEALLAEDGDVQGESRDANRRLLIIPPVGGHFRGDAG